MLKLTISRYTTKTVNTTKGKSLKCNFNAGGQWYNAWVGAWNRDWQDGTVIEIPEDRIESNNYNGKNYLNIKAPPKSASGGNTASAGGASTAGGGTSAADSAKLDRLVKASEVLYKEIVEIKKTLQIIQDKQTKF